MLRESNEVCLWSKKGDFLKSDRIYNPNRMDSFRRVTYINQTYSSKKITLKFNSFIKGNKSNLNIELNFDDIEIYKRLLTKIWDENLFPLKKSVLAFDVRQEEEKQVVYLSLDNDQNTHFSIKLLNCINAILPLGKQVKDELLNILYWRNISQMPDNLHAFYEGFEKLLDDNKLDEVIEKAKSIENIQLFFRLAKYCEDNKKFDYAIALYQEIPKENIFYEEANLQALHLMMLYHQYLPENSIILSADEERQLLVNEFLFSLRSKDQRLTDKLYHQLCGETGLTPCISKVACNEDTLIAIAEHANHLKKENVDLKKENADLKAKMEELNKNQNKNIARPEIQKTKKRRNSFFSSSTENQKKRKYTDSTKHVGHKL